jgi:hypothetical protein
LLESILKVTENEILRRMCEARRGGEISKKVA